MKPKKNFKKKKKKKKNIIHTTESNFHYFELS